MIASFGAAGATRGDVIGAVKVKGDKAAEQSVSSALAALKKSGAASHRDGKYIIATGEPAATEAATPAAG